MTHRHTLLLAAIFAYGCASAPPATPPEWTAVPRGVLDSFCIEVRAEGLARENPINVVSSTQPITPAAIAALGERASLGLHNAADVAQQLNAALPHLPVEVPTDVCPWNAVDKLDTRRDVDMMVVQVTAPFVNPFDRREAGLMLRLSLGGQSSLWFWVPTTKRADRWIPGRVQPLGAQE